MKTSRGKMLFMLVALFVTGFPARAVEVYYFYFNGLHKSYARVTYTKSESDSGTTHTLSCSDPGNNSCCWPLIPVIRKNDVVYSYDDIHEYVMTQVAQKKLQGEIMWQGEIPVRWKVNDEGIGEMVVYSE